MKDGEKMGEFFNERWMNYGEKIGNSGEKMGE